VTLLNQQEFGILMLAQTVGKYLKLWGFTPQKPINKAYEQCAQAVQAWLKNIYPAIAAINRQADAGLCSGLFDPACAPPPVRLIVSDKIKYGVLSIYYIIDNFN